MMRYRIITEATTDELASTVSRMVDLGWKPVGGVAVSVGVGGWVFIQAVML